MNFTVGNETREKEKHGQQKSNRLEFILKNSAIFFKVIGMLLPIPIKNDKSIIRMSSFPMLRDG